MMNLCSLSNLKRMLIGCLVLFFARGILVHFDASIYLINSIFALLVVLLLASIIMVSRISRELTRTLNVMASASEGDLSSRITHIPTGDIGTLMHYVNRLLDQSDAFIRESEASMRFVSCNRYFRRILQRGLKGDFERAASAINEATSGMEERVLRFQKLNHGFENSVKGVVGGVASAATELHATAEVMSDVAKAADGRSKEISKSSEATLHNVQSIAASSEQLSISVQNVTDQVTEASHKANTASKEAKQAVEIITQLEQSSGRIGEISQLINRIADRTNLLALNASIEASRAGESGRGFAVVAQEVKDLARQTGEATNEIGQKISEIQGMTNKAVVAINDTSEYIDDLDKISARTASAVNEQSSSTNEISQNMHDAVQHASGMNDIIESLNQAVQETNDAVDQTLEAAGELSQQAEFLNGKVDGYMKEMNSA